ncbi:copia protein [Tanacetum coccineum]
MQNLKDISNPTTALDMALKLTAKAFQLNNSTSTNNNQRRNLVGHNAVQNQGIQNIGNQNELSVILGIANQHGNGNVVAAQDEGNGNGINGNPIRCYNCQGVDHYANNCTVKPRKRDAAYL